MKRSKLLSASILIALALLLSGASPKPSPRPNDASQTQNTDKSADPDRQQTTSGQAAVVQSPAVNLHKKTEDHTAHPNYEAAQYQLNRYQTAFNFCLVFFTAALVGVGAWQARRLRQTVEATKETAEAAKSSADTSIKALEVAERAYVYAHEVEIIDKLAATHSPRIRVTYINTGKTPAKYFNATVNSELRNDIRDRVHHIAGETAQQALEFHRSTEDWLTRGVVLPPTAPLCRETDLRRGTGVHVLSESEVIKVLQKQLWWFVISAISYRDEFGTLYAIHEVFLYDAGTGRFERRDWDEAKQEQ